MFKNKLILFSLSFLSFFFWVIWLYATEVSSPPVVNCFWLPGCPDSATEIVPVSTSLSENPTMWVVYTLIWEFIQFVWLFAVIALILSGIMFLLSWWDEEKVKKAKLWITWSLLWVVISISAWWIINILNSIQITN